jgi:quinol monooxygenase YgiN
MVGAQRSEEVLMAVCRIIETGATPDQYEQVRSKLGVDENNPPPGGQIHIAAKGDDGTIRVIEVWESREQAEDWGEKVRAVRQELGIGSITPPPITYFEVQRVMTAGARPIEAVGTQTTG